MILKLLSVYKTTNLSCSKLFSSYVRYKYTVVIEYKVYIKSVKLNMNSFCNDAVLHTL